MPKLALLTVQQETGPGLDAGTGYRGMAVLLEDDPRINIKAPALLFYNGSPEGDIYPGLVAAISDDAANFFSTQASRLVFQETTTDATPFAVFSRTLEDNTAYRLSVAIVARRSDAADRAKYVREALVYRQAAGSATIEGSVQLPVADVESDADWDVTIDVSGNDVKVLVTGLDPTAASKAIQDLTYTAKAAGTGGNAITIAYTTGGTTGAEAVTVVGNAISVKIHTGVSTATQVKAAVDASAAASALVSVAITGTGSTAQTAPVSATPLLNGVSPAIDWTARIELEKVG